MTKKICIISEDISFPFDEGFKNISCQIINNLIGRENVHPVTKKEIIAMETAR